MRRSLMDRATVVAQYVLTILFIMSWPWVLKAGKIGAPIILFQVAIVLAASGLSEAYRERRIDEVELAAARFGSQWGTFAGMCIVILLLFTPPFQYFLVDVANWTDKRGNMAIPTEMLLFGLGVTLTVILQSMARFLLAAFWKLSKR